MSENKPVRTIQKVPQESEVRGVGISALLPEKEQSKKQEAGQVEK